jgi:hypothetical protein
LIEAFADEATMVEARHILTVCRDLHLSAPIQPLSPPLSQPSPDREAASAAFDAYPMKTLERYSTGERQSLMGRLRGRLK